MFQETNYTNSPDPGPLQSVYENGETPSYLSPIWHRRLCVLEPVVCCQTQSFCGPIPLQIDDSPGFKTAKGLNSGKNGLLHDSFPLSVNVVSGHEVYSLVYHIQQSEEPAGGETWGGSEFISHISLPQNQEDSLQLCTALWQH